VIESVPIHGGQLRYLAERFAIPVAQLLDFSANINPEGPPETVLATLRASLDDLSVLTNYPDLQQTELRQSIARHADVRPQNIVVANGFVPLLEAALRSLPIRRCLLPVPAFVEYRKVLTRSRVEIIPHALMAASGFHYDAEAMITGQQDALLVANPQNPSGVVCRREALLRLVARAAERDVYVLLDEAFIDYLPEHSLVPDIDRFPNLIVFRSLTKFYGVPGLRVAYAIASPEIASSLHENLPPWPITTLASRAVGAALEDEPYANRTRLLNLQRRVHLQTEIEALGIHIYPSAANFLLLRLPSSVDPVEFWERMIVEHHVVLRSCLNYEALSGEHLRVAVRNERENARLVRAVSQVFATLRERPESKAGSSRT
jgi:threonine-phosphate decarboxylase